MFFCSCISCNKSLGLCTTHQAGEHCQGAFIFNDYRSFIMSAEENLNGMDTSYLVYREKFTKQLSAKYNAQYQNTQKDKKEKKCIEKALSDVTRGSLVLDLPCGTGRLSFFIQNLGFNVIGADYSDEMLKYAEEMRQALLSAEKNQVTFLKQDIMAIDYPDNTFAATVCNRLFHHYASAETRQQALKELARVTQGPLVISFFNSYSLSALIQRCKYFFKKKSNDRVTISFTEFKKDILAANLRIEKTYYLALGLSRQTYVKLIRAV